MNGPKKPEPKPGEILSQRNWTPAEVEEMRAFIQETEPGLWEQLEEVELTTGDFTDLEITNRAISLIRAKHPQGERLDPLTMFGALRRVWAGK
jgi:hypothetical protein